jgi:quercetin dioxygenase-like cupin family protein
MDSRTLLDRTTPPTGAGPALPAAGHAVPPPPPAQLAALTAALADRLTGLAPALAAAGRPAAPAGSLPCLPRVDGPDGPWAVRLFDGPGVEAWLLAWPPGLPAPVHHHGGPAALTVVDGALTEECLDLTVWTTSRRTTWTAPSTTTFPPGHVHALGAHHRLTLAVHAWSTAPTSLSTSSG